MSDAAEPDEPDVDSWARACEEDLAAEKARRRAEHGPQPASAAEELRRLADAVSEKFAEFGRPFGGTVASAAAQGMAQQLFAQAKAAIEPVVERNPQVFDHLAAAGGELLAAYRSAVQEAEGRWTAGERGSGAPTAPGTSAAPDDRPAAGAEGPAAAEGPTGADGPERIHLDKESGEPETPGESAAPGGPRATGQPKGPKESKGPAGSGGSAASGGPEGPRDLGKPENPTPGDDE